MPTTLPPRPSHTPTAPLSPTGPLSTSTSPTN
jgi:hypothetical protein